MLSRCGCDRIRAFLQPGTDLLRPLTPDSAPLPPRRTWKRWCAERKPSRTPIRSILQRHWGRWLRRMPCSGYSDTLTPRSPRARLRSLAARAHWSRPAATTWDPPVLDGGVPGRGAAQPEIFGPVLVFLPFDTVEEAVTITNGIPFGSAASMWTEDPSTAHLTAKGIRTGTVGSTAMRPQMSRRSGAETEPNCGRRPPSSVRTRSSSSYGWQTRPPCTNGSPRRRSSRRRRPSKPP